MNETNPKRKGTRVLTSALVLVALTLILASSWAMAQEPQSALPDPKALAASPEGWGDDGVLEVGVEWINDFPGTVDDRSHWDESCDGLYYRLLADGWSSRFHWTDWSAWETDFKSASRGGSENSYADNVDIAMLCTHGSGAWDDFWSQGLSSVYFGSTHTDQDLVPGDAYQAYGDKDLEWLAFDSCSVLSDGGPAPYYNRGYWAATMNGLHLLLGFSNTMYVWAPGDGYKWADYLQGWKPSWWPFGYLRPPYTVTQAWFAAVDDVQPSVTCARVLAEVPDNYNDYLWGKGYVSPDPVHDGTYWHWDHCSAGTLQNLGSPQQKATPLATMPIFEVINRPVDEAFIRQWIAPSFGMSGTMETDGQYFYLIDTSQGQTKTLQVDVASGGWKWLNLSKLWVPTETPPRLPSYDSALVTVDNFFAQQGESLPGAWYRDFVMPSMDQRVGVEMAGVGIDAQEQILEQTPTDIVLTYGRQVTALAGSASGLLQQTFPVVGPGGTTRAYIGDGGEMIGLQGGARDVQATGGQVTVMSADEAWNLFLADHSIALPQVPWVADEIVKTTEMLGYYEFPLFQSQTELIPVWIFSADFYAGGTLLAGGVQVYVPAATDYLPPLVQIDSPADGDQFRPGQMVTLSGSVVDYGTAPFTFEWTSSLDGFLGSGQTLATPLLSEAKAGQVVSNTITLHVIDAHGLQGTDSVTVFVRLPVYLPLINKNG